MRKIIFLTYCGFVCNGMSVLLLRDVIICLFSVTIGESFILHQGRN